MFYVTHRHYPLSSAPKEKPCCTLPTVKKLLEQKRKRETATALPSCAPAIVSPPHTSTTAVRQSEELQIHHSRWSLTVFDFPVSPVFSSSPSRNLSPPQVRVVDCLRPMCTHSVFVAKWGETWSKKVHPLEHSYIKTHILNAAKATKC